MCLECRKGKTKKGGERESSGKWSPDVRERERDGGEVIEGKGCVCIIDHNPCGSVHPLCRLGTDGAHVCTFACHPCVCLLGLGAYFNASPCASDNHITFVPSCLLHVALAVSLFSG